LLLTNQLKTTNSQACLCCHNLGEHPFHAYNQPKEHIRQLQEEQKQLSKELNQKEEERLQALFDEALQMVASTKQALQEETERLRQELRRQAEEMAQMVTEKVLGRKVS
jgi:F0F1-type ATP synthase membrane subunit b/b'